MKKPHPKATVLLIAALSTLALVHHTQAGPPKTVALPAGSVDRLAAAVAAAGPGGTVVVKSGLHTENGTTCGTTPVNIVGEPGAEISCGTLPAPNMTLLGGDPSPVSPSIHVVGTANVQVRGITAGAAGWTTKVVEKAVLR